MKLPRRRRLGSSLAQGLLTGMALGYTAYRAATLVVNARTFPRLDRKHAAVSPRPKVSLLTPARDEAHNVPKLLGGLLRQGADEVILLDDHSSDGTGDIARELCQGVPGARVVSGTPLPEGWAGKNWACHQLSQAASGDVLIFVDADVEWKNGALDALLAELERSEADLLSCWPRQNVGSAQERLITPLIDLYLLSLLPYPAMQLPLVATATAVGQVMVFRRAAYDAVGGHTLVQGDVLEDVLFAKRLKARGYRVMGVLGGGRVGVRMYNDYASSVNGYAKSWLPVHGNSRLALATALAGQLCVYTLPWLLDFPGARLLRATSLLERAAIAWVAGRREPADLAEGLIGPIQPLLMLPIYRKAIRKQVQWKGRVYQQ
ncbi:glycosyltransferase [Deinococcus radiophilus]|uniref:Glycosyltransferase n=1 Tax=Deinococcus radiophilus TaxID=32062 RepID=A0A3S0KEZ7_9DEIO|nr:glycosyltransferase family 2 protein [Deinococcus radiophilus]RTR25255.1 glycosyltransferase [Deinococcus radiophilus]UFA50278.1 glycosyltransferase [Deinococcus radiophilus]